MSRAIWHRPGFLAGHALFVVVAVLIGWQLPYSNQLATTAGLLAVIVAIGIAVARIRRPMTGAELLVLVAVLTPLEGYGWVSTSLALAVATIALWFFRQVVVRKQLIFPRSASVAASLGLMLVAVFAFAAGQFPWFAVDPAPMRAQIAGLALFLASGGLLLFVGSVASRRDVRRLTWLFVAVGMLSVLLTATGRSEIRSSGMIISTSSSLGSVFYIWLVALSAGQGVWNRTIPTVWRGTLIGLAVLVLLHQVVVLFTWVSAWLPPMIALATILLVRAPRLTLAAAGVLAVFLLDFAPEVNPVMVNESWSLTTRAAAAELMADLIAYSPLIGFGPANYHFYTSLFPLLGYHVRFASHNNYIDVAAQTGIVGLVVFVSLLLAILWTTFRLARRVLPGFEKAYVMGALGGVVGTVCSGVLGDWIIPFVYNVGVQGFRASMLFWLFAGGVLAIDRMLREQERHRALDPRPGRLLRGTT